MSELNPNEIHSQDSSILLVRGVADASVSANKSVYQVNTQEAECDNCDNCDM